ncbi:MAG TPA: hypothetical protein VLE22_08045 [Bryobacteraceae bacterium]|nr:hypothetical protein [Bryobacteraceae bacterium]
MSRTIFVPLVTALSWTVWPAMAAQPDPQAIVRRSIEVDEESGSEILRNFIFVERSDKKDLDGDGHVKSRVLKTHEVVMHDGTPIRRLIAQDDKPLSAEEQRSQEEGFRKAIEARKRESATERQRRIRESEERRTRYRRAIREIPDAFSFRLAGAERVGGRPAWVLDAEPRPGYRPKDRYSKLFTQLKGRLWIDQDDYHWARAEAELLDSVWFGWILVRIARGAKVKMDQMRLNDGLWVTKHLWYTASARVGLIMTYHVEEEFDYRDYRKVDLESLLAGNVSSH